MVRLDPFRYEVTTMNDTVKTALIYGSTRPGRLCDTVAGWAGEQIWSHGRFRLDVVDPAELAMPDSAGPSAHAESLVSMRRRLARADAFVVVTPEYNHGYPAPLKALIDSANAEWHAKPVAFVSYGGISGGLRAVEQLRLVFAELHAVTIRDTVSFANASDRFDADARLIDGEAAETSMRRLLASLHWWATALGNARNARPYDAARAA